MSASQPHVLIVVNDYPPKHGGIQTYLHELVRRLPAGSATVLTTPHDDAPAFDAGHPHRIVRDRSRVLWPTPALARRINRLAKDVGADRLLIDPPIPLGLLHRRLSLPYHVVVHGGVVGYARPPIVRPRLARVLRGAAGIISAGSFPAAEATRAAGGSLPPVTVIPPGVDVDRFQPLDQDDRAAARAALGLPVDGRLVLGLSRLVPRKGFDVVIEAVARLAHTRPDLTLAIAGSGRDRPRLERKALALEAPVTFLGRVSGDDLARLYACVDVFAMVCRTRWGGLEQEGFGIVYLEAAASGIPQVAGRSGGSFEAVHEGRTGTVVDHPRDVGAVAAALRPLLDDTGLRQRWGLAARQRAKNEFSYDILSARLAQALGLQ